MWKSPGGYPIYEPTITMTGSWLSPTPKKWVDIWLIYGYYMVNDG